MYVFKNLCRLQKIRACRINFYLSFSESAFKNTQQAVKITQLKNHCRVVIDYFLIL